MAVSTKEKVGSATSSKGVPFILRFYHRRFAYIIAIPIVLYEGIFLFYPMAEGVRDSLTGTLDVSGNWWGTAVGPNPTSLTGPTAIAATILAPAGTVRELESGSCTSPARTAAGGGGSVSWASGVQKMR